MGGAESINAYADTSQVARVMYCLCNPQLYNTSHPAPPPTQPPLLLPRNGHPSVPVMSACASILHHPPAPPLASLPHHPPAPPPASLPHHPPAPPCALQSPVHHPIPHSCYTHPSPPPPASLLHDLEACPRLQCCCLEQQRRSIGRADQRAAGAGVNTAGGRGRGEAMLRQGGWQEGWHITWAMVGVVEACQEEVVTRRRGGRKEGRQGLGGGRTRWARTEARR